MSLAVYAGGTLFQKGSGASSETFTTVPEVHKLTAPNSKFDLLETTSHDSTGGFKEYMPGLVDGENVSATFHFKPTNTIHTAIHTDAYNRTLRNWKIIFPDPSAASPGAGATMAFAAYVTGFPPTADVNTILDCAMSAKVTGFITWS